MPGKPGIMKRAADAARAVLHADGWINALTGIGFSGRDKTLNTTYQADILADADAEELYRGDDMAARIIDTIPDEMLRQGFSIKIDSADSEDDERGKTERAIKSALDDLKATDKLKEAMKYERAYGGGAILIGADDGSKDLKQPLNLANIKAIKWLTVLRKSELIPTEYFTDPSEEGYGEPSVYRIQPETTTGTDAKLSQVEVHASRFILFKGIKVSRTQVLANNGWGDSVLVRCNRIISQFNQSWGGAAILLADFAQAVIKIKGLAELLASNNCDAVQNRAAGVDIARSIARAIIIDSEEEYERKATPITGMSDMLQQFALRLSACAEMPVSRLMGQAPAGLNATGDSDIRFFYDQVAYKRNDKLTPPLEYLTKIVMLAKAGPTRGIEPESWQIEYPSLWQPSEVQAAEIRLKTAQADDIWLGHDVFTPEECGTSHFGGPTFSTSVILDMKTRRLLASLATTEEKSTPEGRVLPLTPTDLATILTVNQVLSHPTLGYGPKLLPSGERDPEGDLTVAEYQTKHGAVIAQATAVTAPVTAAPPPAAPRTDSRGRILRTDSSIACLARTIGYPHMFERKPDVA